MNTKGDVAPRVVVGTGPIRTAMLSIRARILGGLILVMPILLTLWVLNWFYSTLEKHVIDPLALLILWHIRRKQADTVLPHWFEAYAAPILAILIAILILYLLGFVVRTRFRRGLDWLLLRVPLMSPIYDGIRKIFQSMDQQGTPATPQRVVLVTFPHPGIRVPGFVTGSCRDRTTQKLLLCVYVPTTPVPTSGYFLLVPEEETIDPGWTSEQTLQAIISGGLSTPQEVNYYRV